MALNAEKSSHLHNYYNTTIIRDFRVLTACSSIMPVSKSAFLKKCIVLLTRKSNSQIAKDVTFNSLNQSPNHRPE